MQVAPSPDDAFPIGSLHGKSDSTLVERIRAAMPGSEVVEVPGGFILAGRGFGPDAPPGFVHGTGARVVIDGVASPAMFRGVLHADGSVETSVEVAGPVSFASYILADSASDVWNGAFTPGPFTHAGAPSNRPDLRGASTVFLDESMGRADMWAPGPAPRPTGPAPRNRRERRAALAEARRRARKGGR